MWSIKSCGRYEIIYTDACLTAGVSEALCQSQLAITESAPQGAVVHWTTGWVNPRPRNRSAQWGLENNIACYGQEKKLWVSIAVCVCLPPSVCLSHTTENLTPRRIEREIFIQKCCGSSFSLVTVDNTFSYGLNITTAVLLLQWLWD